MKRLSVFCGLSLLCVFLLLSCENQDPIPDDGVPVLSLLPEDGILALSHEAGTFLFEYNVENPVEEGVLAVSLSGDIDWISNVVDPDPSSTEGTIKFKVSENVGAEERSAVFVVTYTVGDDVVSSEMTIMQDVASFDYDFTAVAALCRYFGDRGDAYEYEVILGDPDYSEKAPGGEYYVLTFFGDKDIDGDMLVTPGVYTILPSGSDVGKGNINSEYSIYTRISREDLKMEIEIEPIGGEIKVERDGDIFTISGCMIDKSEYRHKIYYHGTIDAKDADVSSTFFDDVDEELTGMDSEVEFWGDNYQTETNIWLIKLFPSEISFGAPCLQIQVATDLATNLETGLVSMTFTEDPDYTYEAGTFFPGKFGLRGCWYYHTSGVANSGRIAIGDPSAPLSGGTVKLTKNDDDTFSLNVESGDDAGHSIILKADRISFNYINKFE